LSIVFHKTPIKLILLKYLTSHERKGEEVKLAITIADFPGKTFRVLKEKEIMSTEKRKKLRK